MLHAPITVLLAAATADPAHACGGFACDNQVPVLQAAERVVFGVDQDAGEVEMHVQVTYEGGAVGFGWIVPVPADPELFLTTSSLFTQVARATLPTFTLTRQQEGACDLDQRGDDEGSFTDSTGGSSSSGGDDSNGPPEVTVVSEQVIGPYETAVLRAASADDLLAWLDEAGFQVPPGIADVLQPYVADDASFVALKLAAGQDTGDLAPLGLRYRSDKAAIPVRLTSVSATPDMRMEVYVFGEARAVPESYLHVGINDLAIDWWQAGANYADVITQAADEAGGHAFATDYFGGTNVVPPFQLAAIPEAELRAATSGLAWLEIVRQALVTAPLELFPVLEDAFGLAAGDGATFWACPDCVAPSVPFDASSATDLVLERVFRPLERAQALVDGYPQLARMTSSLDAVEMTVDPTFVMNADLAEFDVDNAWTATLVTECDPSVAFDEAPRRLELARSGLTVRLPSERDLADMGLTEFEYLASLRDNNAVVVEQLGAEGRGEVIVDHRPGLAVLVTEFNRLVGVNGCGGGCGTAGSASGLGFASIVLLWARRRASRR